MEKPLLIGYGREGTFSHLANFIRDSGIKASILDLHSVEECRHLSLCHTATGMELQIDDTAFKIGNGSVFYRGFFRKCATQEMSLLLHDFLSELESGLQLLPENLLVLNRPLAGISNSSKARHIKDLGACGFLVPRTLVSSVPEKVEALVAPNGQWINKGCSGTRTMAVAVGGPEVSCLRLLENCPSLFQPLIRGFDVRAHITLHGDVTLKIESTRVDYRYAERQGGHIEVQRIDLPAAQRFKALEFMRRTGLCFAGFDFKVDEDGQWWLLEANPMPGFEFFDKFAGNEIAKLVINSLHARYLPGLKPECTRQGIFIQDDRIPTVDRGS